MGFWGVLRGFGGFYGGFRGFWGVLGYFGGLGGRLEKGFGGFRWEV